MTDVMDQKSPPSGNGSDDEPPPCNSADSEPPHSSHLHESKASIDRLNVDFTLCALPADTLEAEDLETWLGANIREALEYLEVHRAQLSVAMVDDAEMARLHEQFKKVPGTTDVLTFDLAEPPAESLTDQGAPAAIDAEVIVCLDEAQRQAESHGHGWREELLLYIVHGLLHLLGYDDHDPKQSVLMHAKEDEILIAIGVGVVFGHRGASSMSAGDG